MMNEEERGLDRYKARIDQIERAKMRGDAFLARAERKDAAQVKSNGADEPPQAEPHAPAAPTPGNADPGKVGRVMSREQGAASEPQRGVPGNSGEKPVADAKRSRAELLLAAWLTRKLPLRDYLLGTVFCTTSRWLIFGDTGIGKTLFALSMAAAMASGHSFLGWAGKRRACVMYLDGEMPAETFKDRMKLVADECGADVALYGYNRDVLGSEDLPPLNTPEGEAWLWREIDAVKPDVIIFDAIMCLLSGTMGEEESWASIKLLIRKISSRRIAQIWLHHTGHDPSKGFGTKTREWEMDTVVSLTTAESGQSICMDFKKARLRTPQTADQFKPLMIARNETGWTATEVEVAKAKGSRRKEVDSLRLDVLATYDRLAEGVPTSPGPDGTLVRKISVEKLRDELKSCGFLEAKDTGGLTETARKQFQRAKSALLSGPKPRLVEREGLIWK